MIRYPLIGQPVITPDGFAKTKAVDKQFGRITVVLDMSGIERWYAASNVRIIRVQSDPCDTSEEDAALEEFATVGIDLA